MNRNRNVKVNAPNGTNVITVFDMSASDTVLSLTTRVLDGLDVDPASRDLLLCYEGEVLRPPTATLEQCGLFSAGGAKDVTVYAAKCVSNNDARAAELEKMGFRNDCISTVVALHPATASVATLVSALTRGTIVEYIEAHGAVRRHKDDVAAFFDPQPGSFASPMRPQPRLQLLTVDALMARVMEYLEHRDIITFASTCQAVAQWVVGPDSVLNTGGFCLLRHAHVAQYMRKVYVSDLNGAPFSPSTSSSGRFIATQHPADGSVPNLSVHRLNLRAMRVCEFLEPYVFKYGAGEVVTSVAHLKPGDIVECLDTVRKWYDATIIDYSPERGCALIHYHFWGNKWDEWVTVGPRIAPLGTNFNPSVSYFDPDKRVDFRIVAFDVPLVDSEVMEPHLFALTNALCNAVFDDVVPPAQTAKKQYSFRKSTPRQVLNFFESRFMFGSTHAIEHMVEYGLESETPAFNFGRGDESVATKVFALVSVRDSFALFVRRMGKTVHY